MDYLWTPWRYSYVSGLEAPNRAGRGCVFCSVLESGTGDRESLIVHRGTRNFVMLNRYPYTSGHMVVIPYAHVATLGEAPAAAAAEMMRLTRRIERLLQALYQPTASISA